MKKLVGTAVAGLMAFALVGGPAAAGKATQQHVEGTIALRAPFANQEEQLESCYAGVHRRLSLVAGEQARGIVGWDFEIDPGTYNKPFKLEVAGGAADLDLTFYMNGLGSVQDHVDNPPWGSTLATVDFEERGNEGEAGIVPKGATHAIVCMFDGSQSSFMYMAGKGVK